MIEFNKQKMLKFVQIDLLLNRVYLDLQARGHQKDYALKIIFNSYVLGDPVMEDEYIKLSINSSKNVL